MKVNYYGEIVEITNKTCEDVILKNTSLSELLLFLKSTYELNSENIQIAVNYDIIAANTDKILIETDEIAILSPFAGG